MDRTGHLIQRTNTRAMHPALFLDRDGVIIENRDNYVRSWADVSIYPRALAALAWVGHFPIKIVIVTNQSVVGRGLIPLAVAKRINVRLAEAIMEAGGRVDGIFMCPHHPEDGCMCRKPQPGLLLRAAAQLSLDLERSMMVGDALTDLLAAEAAGVPRRVLVRTGRGQAQEQLPQAKTLLPFHVHDNLSLALWNQLSHKRHEANGSGVQPQVQPRST